MNQLIEFKFDRLVFHFIRKKKKKNTVKPNNITDGYTNAVNGERGYKYVAIYFVLRTTSALFFIHLFVSTLLEMGNAGI